MPRGYLCLLLHAHLPFVRHPEYPEFLEEKWLFEAVADCYLPLLAVFERLAGEKVPFRVTVSISPTLAAMLEDDLLRSRCRAWIGKQRDLSRGAAPSVAEHFERAAREFDRRDGRVLAGFLALRDQGCIEIITTAATHGFLPLLKNHKPTVRAQIRVALDEHLRRFGGKPRGFWLPECGFYPDLVDELAGAGIEYTVVDTHGLLSATPPSPHGPHAPVVHNGLAVFARDPDSAREIWGAGGFPGAAHYRDFHARDEHGFKPFAVTGPVGEKWPYDPKVAKALAMSHAQQFIQSRIAHAAFTGGRLKEPPVMVAAYDAELFGHWWHEGPAFLEYALRSAAGERGGIETITLSDYLDRHRPGFAAIPGASSWGQHGFSEYWLNSANHWIYPELGRAARRFAAAHKMVPGGEDGEGGLRGRALRQAARSLLLAQASDWPFLMTRGPSAGYAEKRLRDQLARVHYLCDGVERDAIHERRLRALEKMDNLFPRLDCRHFAEL